MGSIGLLKWRKAYMLEFLDGTNVAEVFTFSVPPESEEFVFPQRLTETKTFGGSVFDDYGNDTYKITLSGSTINEDKKFIYRGLNPPLYLTGTKEIFELQKIIQNWADGKVSTGFFRKGSSTVSKRKVYLYDLSKMSVLQIASGTATRNYWRVFIKELKIKRDKSKPKTYNYTLEMIGVEEEKERKTGNEAGFLDSLAGSVDDIQDAMDKVTSVMDLAEASTSALNQMASALSHAMKSYERMKNRKNAAVTVMLGVGTGRDAVSRILGGDSNSFYNSTKNVLAACSTFIGIARGNGGARGKSSTSQDTDVFTVRFSTGDGSGIPTQHVKYSKTAEKPAEPIYPKYRFGGWFNDRTYTDEYNFATEVTANITIYAKWILQVATVSYNSKNGSRVIPQEVSVGEKTTAPTPPTRNGYIFHKWCTDYECKTEFSFDTAIRENITLYAAWQHTCCVVFNANGGSAVVMQTVIKGSLAVYPITPKKENYTFAYWCTDNALTEVYDFSTPVMENIT
ncbi:MAG: InlB B-repeat-containing protein, partial [Treponema sp.]|uniref:InlB B-repeat-containing protein n=1 Tax=Treponema sp. TaxID=166 RepID=UPI003FA2464C